MRDEQSNESNGKLTEQFKAILIKKQAALADKIANDPDYQHLQNQPIKWDEERQVWFVSDKCPHTHRPDLPNGEYSQAYWRQFSQEDVTYETIKKEAEVDLIKAGHVDFVDQTRDLPELKNINDILEHDIELPPEIIQGILSQGSKFLIGGGSKSYKTWILLHLAMNVASGHPWFEHETIKTKVLYINLEIQPIFFAKRIQMMKTTLPEVVFGDTFDVWDLRGHTITPERLLTGIMALEKAFGLIVIDPFYKITGGANENAANEMGLVFNQLDKITTHTGSAVVIGTHFSKGNQAAKESIDRMSGSGVFARDPDSLMTLTPHDEKDCLTAEFTLRNFKPIEPFVIQTDIPHIKVRDDLDPSQLKEANKGGRPSIYTAHDLIINMPDDEPIKTRDWKAMVIEETGMKEDSFFTYLKELQVSAKIKKVKHGTWKKMD